MRFFARAVIVSWCLGISACSGSEAVRGKDTVFFPYLRASVPIGDFENKKAALEIDVSNGRGKDTQGLAGGEVAEVGGHEFIGPARLKLKFDLLEAAAQARFGIFEIGPVRAEVMAGAGLQRLRLEAESGSIRETDRVFSIGPLVGGGLNIHPLDWMDIQVRWRTIPLAFGEVLSGMSRFEAMTLFRVAPHVRLAAGWTRLHYLESLGDSKVETDLRLSGFFGGLEFFK